MGSVRSCLIIACVAIISVAFLPTLPSFNILMLLFVPVLLALFTVVGRRLLVSDL